MQHSPTRVVDIGAIRARRRAAGPASAGEETSLDQSELDAQAVVESLLEVTPNLDRLPPQLLTDARQFCIAQLAATLPRYADDQAPTVHW